MESVLADLPLKRALGDVLYRKIENWAQFSSFVDVSSRRAVTSTQVLRPVAKLIHQKVEEQVEKLKEIKKIAKVPSWKTIEQRQGESIYRSPSLFSIVFQGIC